MPLMPQVQLPSEVMQKLMMEKALDLLQTQTAMAILGNPALMSLAYGKAEDGAEFGAASDKKSARNLCNKSIAILQKFMDAS